jgi:serine/threonine protein phosphatase PrpC
MFNRLKTYDIPKHAMSSTHSSVICASSNTYRQVETDNQDSAGIARDPRGGIRAVLVADGLGSHAYAALGARWALEAAAAFIDSGGVTLNGSSLCDVFVQAREQVRERAAIFCLEKGVAVDREQSFGTTLIVAAETDTSIVLGYVGNGAIWHLRGNFDTFSDSVYVPWNAMNYLNPHSIQDGAGKEALYKLISISDQIGESIPTILNLQKDEKFGDVIIICTDGICSNDQPQVGRVKDGSIWVQAEPLVLRCFEWLRNVLSRPEICSEGSVNASLNELLSNFRLENALEDDASLGVIITGAAWGYHARRVTRQVAK